MLLCFNQNGVLKEIKTYGSPARTGTTNFKIIAYFDGVDIDNDSATIKFVRPDYNSTTYPLLFMIKNMSSFTYDSSVGGESDYFVNGETYPVFEFDFANFSSSEDILLLLDTPGLWKAVISLYDTEEEVQTISVQGEATFNVESGTVSRDEDETIIDADTLLSMVAIQLSTKADITYVDNNFVRELSMNITGTTTLKNVYNEIGYRPAIVHVSGGNWPGTFLVRMSGAYSNYLNFRFIDLSNISSDSSIKELTMFVGHTVDDTTLMTNILAQNSQYRNNIPTNKSMKEYVAENAIKKFGLSQTSSLSTLNDLYGLIGYEPALVYIQNIGWLFGRLKETHNGYCGFEFKYLGDNKRYYAGDISLSTTLSYAFSNSGPYVQDYATEGYVSDYVDNALESYVEKTTDANIVYGTNLSGEQYKVPYSVNATGLSLAQRDNNGAINVGAPTADTHATSKSYVDTGLAEKQNTLVSGANIKTINGKSILGSGNLETIPIIEVNASDTTGTFSASDLSILVDEANVIIKRGANYYHKVGIGGANVITFKQFASQVQVGAYDFLIATPTITVHKNTRTWTYFANESTFMNRAGVNAAIENIEMQSDVIDVLGTYQDLQNYDTSNVKLNDLIKVIDDETHDDATSYYRWQEVSGTEQWVFVASEGPYYTKSQVDGKFVSKDSYDSITGNKDFSGQINFNQDGTTKAVRTTQVPTNNNDIVPKWYVDNSFVFATDSEIDALFE